MQAEASFRSDIDGVAMFHVRSADGTMVPLSSLVTSTPISAPSMTQRYNGYRTAEIGGGEAGRLTIKDARATGLRTAEQ